MKKRLPSNLSVLILVIGGICGMLFGTDSAAKYAGIANPCWPLWSVTTACTDFIRLFTVTPWIMASGALGLILAIGFIALLGGIPEETPENSQRLDL